MIEALSIALPPVLGGLAMTLRRASTAMLLLGISLGWMVAAGLRLALILNDPISTVSNGQATYYVSGQATYLAGVGVIFLIATGLIWLQTWAGRMIWPRLTKGLIWVWSLAVLAGLTLPGLLRPPQRYTDYEDWFRLVNRLNMGAAGLSAAAITALLALTIASVLRGWLHPRR